MVLGLRVVEFMPDIFIVIPGRTFLIELHNVHHGLGVLLLFFLRDTIFLQHTLPILRETLK